MFKKSICRKASFWIAGLSFVWMGSVVHGQPFHGCEEALAATGGGISLTDATTTTTNKGVDEWESDIIKIAVPRPGVLVLFGEGFEAQGSLYDRSQVSGSPRLEDSGQLGTAHRPLTVVVGPGEHCVRVTSSAGATGTLRLRATFFDVCRLGPQDDHGDSFLCSTEIGLGETRTGAISAADQDVFSFALATASIASITLTGAPDLVASLYGEDGILLTGDARGSHALLAGRYFLRVEGSGGAQGTYGVAVASNP
jgi:hypothetical protein